MAEKGTVKTDRFEMEYASFGSGNEAFVILPGISLKSVIDARDAVEAAYAVIAEKYKVYLFDRRKEIPCDYSIYDMADDTAAAFRKLGLKKVNLFGASQGGMIAQVMAIRYPELVNKLILGSSSSHVKEEQRKVIDRWIELAEKKDRQCLYHSFASEIYPIDVYEQFKEFFTKEADTVTDRELEKFVIMARSIKGFSVTDELGKIECPVLALGVYEDAVLDSDATMEIAEKLDHRKDFALYMYKGFGHAAFDTAPDYKKRILDFLLGNN